jgi:hypothetical protein
MSQLDFYLDTTKVNEDIENWRDLEIEVNFTEGIGKIKTGNLDFVGSISDKINTWNANGLTGGPGLLEAPPFRIEVCGGEVVFSGGIDTAACETLYECDKISAPLRESSRGDFLDDRANSFSFAYLASPSMINQPGYLSQTDYVLVPYVINSIPNYLEAITGIISLFVMVKELQQTIDKVADLIAGLQGAIIPVAPPVALTVGMILWAIFQIVAFLVYAVILVIAIIDLTMLIFSSLIQTTKYKKGIRVSTLFQKACDYLGFIFSSSILINSPYKDLVILPKKTAFDTNTSMNYGFVNAITNLNFKFKQYDDAVHPGSTGYFGGTFGDLINAMEDVFNAKTTPVKNSAGVTTLHFERADFFASYSTYRLPNIKFEPHATNACELAGNYYLTYALDSNETNTYDQYEGNNCQHIDSPVAVNNKGNILIRRIDERRLIFARAKMKTQNSPIEDIFNVLYNVTKLVYDVFWGFVNISLAPLMLLLAGVSAILSAAGINVPAITSPLFPPFPPNPLGNRNGMLLLSSDFIGVPKLLIVDSNNHVSASNEQLTSAVYLIDYFHFINFTYTTVMSDMTTPHFSHNQWLIYKDKEIPFCCGDYLAVLNNNYIKTYDNQNARIDTLVWNPYKDLAKITFRVKEIWTKNIQEQYLINKN